MPRYLIPFLLLLCIAVSASAQITSFNWVVKQGAAGADATYAVATDGNGYSYFAGTFSGMVNFGGVTLTSAGASDAFVAKCSPLGVLVWAKKLGAPTNAEGHGIAVGPDRSVYVTGFTYDSAMAQPGTNVNRLFVSRYDSAGRLVWSLKASGRGNAGGTALAISRNSLYLTGTVIDTLNLGGFGISVTPGPSATSAGILTARIDTSGHALWLKKGAAGQLSNSTDVPHGICLDPNENIYVAGSYLDTINFSGSRLGSPHQTPAAPFITSYDSSGKLRWARTYATLGTSANGVCYSQGALFTTGTVALAMRFAPNASVDHLLTNTGMAFGAQTITSDGMGGIFIAGPLPAQLNVNPVTLPSQSTSLYLLKLDTGLRAQWVANTSSGTITNASLAADTLGRRFIAGAFKDTVRFGLNFAGSRGSTDGFVSMLSERTITCALGQQGPLCPGDSLMIPVRVTSQFYSGNVFTAEISDSLGRFSAPLSLGTAGTQESCTIQAKLPTNLHSGTKYRIRVRASFPIFTSSDNGFDIAVRAIPAASVTPNGTVDICEQDSVILQAAGGVAYRWSNGDTTARIVVSTAGNYSVYVLGASGCGVQLPSARVQVHLLPPVPGIRRQGNTLSSSARSNNQWNRNGVAIPGETGTSYTVTQSATYTVTVSDQYHCSSTSDDFVVVLSGGVARSESGESELRLSVSTGEMLHIQGTVGATIRLQVLDMLGRMVWGSDVHPSDRSDLTNQIRLKEILQTAPTGAYYVRAEAHGRVASIKVMHSH